jgi:hypothetical protein
MPTDPPAVAAIRRRPCPPWCAKGNHRFTADRRTPWDLTRSHTIDFELNGRRRMVDLDSFDEYTVNALRGSGEPDEDLPGEPSISCDQRFELYGGTAADARRLADRVQVFADQLRSAADRLQQITDDGR